MPGCTVPCRVCKANVVVNILPGAHTKSVYCDRHTPRIAAALAETKANINAIRNGFEPPFP